MDLSELELSDDERHLLDTLTSLREKLDGLSYARYKRINPLNENIVDWREKGARFAGPDSVIYESATLIGDVTIGAHAWIGEGCMVDGSGGLTMGDHVVLACGVHIYTHDTVKWALSGGLAAYHHAPVRIGNCVFIGAQAVVTSGVTIGDHVLVCANATVTADVPPYSIVAGTPARRIGEVIVDGADVEFRYFEKTRGEE